MPELVLNKRYRILEKIGEGGMAKVYRAEDLLLGRVVAVKVLREQYSSDPEFLARFQQEARFAASLSHPNVVNVFDVGQENDMYYIVMEFVDGQSLKELIVKDAPFSVSAAVQICEQICAGVGYAHGKSLLHRDIKPQNILVDRDGLVKVTDFGIARGADSTQHTKTGMVLGTVQYFSPEQAQGLPATIQSDLYAVGIILYEMLTDRLPFEGDTSLAVALKQVREPPPAPRLLNPAIPPALQEIILRTLNKNPAQRYHSATALAQALKPFQHYSGDGIEAILAPQTTQNTEIAARQSLIAGERTSVIDTTEEAYGGTYSGPVIRRPSLPPEYRYTPEPPNFGWIFLFLVLVALAALLFALRKPIKVLTSSLFSPPTPIVETQPPSTATPRPPATRTPPPPTPSPIPKPALVVVPPVIGAEQATAEQALKAVGLRTKIITAFDDTTPAGQVSKQDPGANSQVPPGTVVTLTVSKGPNTVAIPNVTGLSLNEAKQQLQAAGFTVGVNFAPSSTIPANQVIGQTPNAGTRAAPGSSVTLTASSGNKIAIPNVIGLTPDEAKQALINAGFNPSHIFIDRLGHSGRPGHVESSTPGPGTLADPNQDIHINVTVG